MLAEYEVGLGGEGERVLILVGDQLEQPLHDAVDPAREVGTGISEAGDELAALIGELEVYLRMSGPVPHQSGNRSTVSSTSSERAEWLRARSTWRL